MNIIILIAKFKIVKITQGFSWKGATAQDFYIIFNAVSPKVLMKVRARKQNSLKCTRILIKSYTATRVQCGYLAPFTSFVAFGTFATHTFNAGPPKKISPAWEEDLKTSKLAARHLRRRAARGVKPHRGLATVSKEATPVRRHSQNCKKTTSLMHALADCRNGANVGPV